MQASQSALTKYPSGSSVKKLTSPFDVKNLWMWNEWDPTCQFSPHIQKRCPNRNQLDPQNSEDNRELVESVFQAVRGQYALWGPVKEQAKWKKVVVEKLERQWVVDNVEVLYPSTERFEVVELHGVVLWEDKDPTKEKKYRLLEGNHRVSAWLESGRPEALPSIIFIGKVKKTVNESNP
jgi:hypothetical protein